MRRPITLFLASAAVYHSADAASTLAFGPSGLCPAPLTTTVRIVPVYYSSYFPGETVIDIFGDGNTINVYGPTTIIITTASVTVTGLPTAPSSPTFNIQLQGLNTKDKRAVSYIGFSGGPGDHGVAVGSQTEAAVFEIIDSFLISDGDFVETELGAGFLKFEKTFSPPTDHSTWNTNMTSVNLFNSAFTTGNGHALFCVASDESIYMELTSEPSFTCTQVTLNAVSGKCIFHCLCTPFTNCLVALSSAGSSTTMSISTAGGSPPTVTSSSGIPLTRTSPTGNSLAGTVASPPASQTTISPLGNPTGTTTSTIPTSTTTSTMTGITTGTMSTATSSPTSATIGITTPPTTGTTQTPQPPPSSQYNTIAYTLPVSSGAPPPTTGVVTVKSTGGYTAGGDPGTPFTVATVGTDGITSTIVIVSPTISLGEGLPTGSAPVVSFPRYASVIYA
jgi:hypothetical protein